MGCRVAVVSGRDAWTVILAMSIAISRKATTVSHVRVRRRLPAAAAAESGHFTGVLRKVWTPTPAGLRCKWVVALGDSEECSEE
jgi:hypothetical protein